MNKLYLLIILISDFEMKPLIHQQLENYHNWSGYEDEPGKHISGAYLEIAAAAF